LAGWERKLLRPRHLEADIRIPGLRPVFGRIDHLGERIDANHNGAALGELDGELPIAATYVEDPAALDIAHVEDQLTFEPLGYGAEL
jgi:hypothetical protein